MELLSYKGAVLDWTHLHSLLEPALNWLSLCKNECSGEDRLVSGQDQS